MCSSDLVALAVEDPEKPHEIHDMIAEAHKTMCEDGRMDSPHCEKFRNTLDEMHNDLKDMHEEHQTQMVDAAAAEPAEASTEAAAADDSTGNDGIFGALFGNPYTSVPLCGLGVMSATATDFYVLDAETQLLGLWCMFVGVSYQNFGGAIGQYFDDIANAHLAEQNAQEMAMVQAMKSTQEIGRASCRERV